MTFGLTPEFGPEWDFWRNCMAEGGQPQKQPKNVSAGKLRDLLFYGFNPSCVFGPG